MAYFPLFVELSGKKCVIVGGGTVARRKAEKLLDFGADLTVIAPKISVKLEKMPVRCVHRAFADSDLDGAFLVIAATDDRSLNHRIYTLCTAAKIPVNSVDDAENCSFLFPALVHEEPVTVGICTGGKAPTFAKYLRMLVDDELDTRTMKIAQILTEQRPQVMQRFAPGAARREAMDAILDICLLEGELPDDAEIRSLLDRIAEAKNSGISQ